MARILIVDDEKNVRKSLALALEDAGHEALQAEGAPRAMEVLASAGIDLLIADIRLGEISGIQLFEKIRAEGYLLPVLFISGNASLTEAVETLKLGGADFLEKPFAPERLLVAVERALRLGELERKLVELRSANPQGFPGPRSEMLGSSPAMQALWRAIEKVAPTKSKILIQGESGSGKELTARAIHRLSAVAKGPFIKVNCAAIPPNLIESELFGHERGAFTGATQLKRGLFELAHGGTIFLDEIAELSSEAQAKVLRILQNQELIRVGGSSVIRVDVRVVAATHQDLSQAVSEGRFREDLFFRINVVPIRSIPLRERREDVPMLLLNFVQDCCKENGFAPKEISPQALDLLMAYAWPGNVRELRNLAERLVIFSGSRIEASDLPPEYAGTIKGEPGAIPNTSHSKLSLHEFKAAAERGFILEALKKTSGNITQAARLLDLERTYLHRKIQEHAIRKSEYF